MAKKKKDIKNLEDERMGLFMNDNSFDLDVMYGRNFLKTDNAQSVILHRINLIETKTLREDLFDEKNMAGNDRIDCDFKLLKAGQRSRLLETKATKSRGQSNNYF